MAVTQSRPPICDLIAALLTRRPHLWGGKNADRAMSLASPISRSGFSSAAR